VRDTARSRIGFFSMHFPHLQQGRRRLEHVLHCRQRHASAVSRPLQQMRRAIQSRPSGARYPYFEPIVISAAPDDSIAGEPHHMEWPAGAQGRQRRTP